jgi:hypothetical protein
VVVDEAGGGGGRAEKSRRTVWSMASSTVEAGVNWRRMPTSRSGQ